jgi:two-component system OmpR family response regulator
LQKSLLRYTEEKVRGFDLRLLVIDDNHEITEAITFYCSTEKDIDCQVVNDGQEGLGRIRNDKFDLILLDVAMPDFSGKDVIESLKRDELIDSTNIVIFTASSNQRLFDEMKNSGVKEVFKKPCSIDDLAEVIEKYRPAIGG